MRCCSLASTSTDLYLLGGSMTGGSVGTPIWEYALPPAGPSVRQAIPPNPDAGTKPSLSCEHSGQSMTLASTGRGENEGFDASILAFVRFGDREKRTRFPCRRRGDGAAHARPRLDSNAAGRPDCLAAGAAHGRAPDAQLRAPPVYLVGSGASVPLQRRLSTLDWTRAPPRLTRSACSSGLGRNLEHHRLADRAGDGGG